MRRVAAPVIFVSAFALSASVLVIPSSATAVAPPLDATAAAYGAEPADRAPVLRGGEARIGVKDLASYAYSVVGVIIECEKLSEQIRGCPEEKSISFVSQKLKDIEAQIARNQQRTEQALDALQKSLDGKDLADAVLRLNPIEAHIFEAAKAWQAMSDCTQKGRVPPASCTGYNGKATATVPVAEGIRLSKVYFLGQMKKIGITVEQATQYFAGTRSIRGTDGFLHALWKSAKREQDRASGVATPVASLTPSIVTRSLALEFLPTMTYYRDMVYLFGALKPAAKALEGNSDEAQSEANLADSKIFAATDRWTVAGAADFYNIPDLPPGAIAYVKDGKLYKIVEGEGRGAPLPSSAVMDLGGLLAASDYKAGPTSVMAQNPQLLPHKGLFIVQEKVKHRTYLRYNRDGGRTNPEWAICANETECTDSSSPYSARKSTFEIGHPDAVGTKDRDGNLMKMRWTPMLVTGVPVTWGDVLDSRKWSEVTGRLGAFAPCYGEVRGEPPTGVAGVQFLQTFRRIVEGKYATFAWDCVGWNYSGNNTRYVGPGVYLLRGVSTGRFSLVEKPLPGVLEK